MLRPDKKALKSLLTLSALVNSLGKVVTGLAAMKYKLYNVKSEKAYKNHELRANHMNTGAFINTCNKLVKALPSLTVCLKPQTLAPKDYLIKHWTPDVVKKQKAPLPLND